MRRPRPRAPPQLLLPVPNTWGGRRRGAGRPVHVTLRARREVGSLRHPRAFGAVQRDHVHLLVEASSRETLIRSVQGLARALRTPREVRHALIGVDPCSSETTTARRVVVSAETWLLRVGWRRHGPIRADEAPRAG